MESFFLPPRCIITCSVLYLDSGRLSYPLFVFFFENQGLRILTAVSMWNITAFTSFYSVRTGFLERVSRGRCSSLTRKARAYLKLGRLTSYLQNMQI